MEICEGLIQDMLLGAVKAAEEEGSVGVHMSAEQRINSIKSLRAVADALENNPQSVASLRLEAVTYSKDGVGEYDAETICHWTSSKEADLAMHMIVARAGHDERIKSIILEAERCVRMHNVKKHAARGTPAALHELIDELFAPKPTDFDAKISIPTGKSVVTMPLRVTVAEPGKLAEKLDEIRLDAAIDPNKSTEH